MSEKINDGGWAFPGKHYGLLPSSSGGFETELYHQGMSLRAWLAGMALEGWAAGRNNGEIYGNSKSSDPDFVAESCIRYADAIIAALENP